MRIIISFLLSVLVSSLTGQAQDQQTMLSGTVLNSTNGKPIAGVHLVSKKRVGTITDLDGNFSMLLSRGDTISITHVGFSEYLVPVPMSVQDHFKITVAMIPSITELEDITVYQWPATVSQFKQRILAATPDQEQKVIIPGSYQGPPKPVKPGVASPISFIQSKLSKKMRRHREFLKKRADIESNQQARTRYNNEYVMEVTGIEDQAVLEEFMAYCKFNDMFLGQVNDYDLILAINECYEDFKSERSE